MAKKILPSAKVIKSHHLNTSFLNQIKDEDIDISFSNSVFQYFYNLNYTKQILHQLLRITKKKIFLVT